MNSSPLSLTRTAQYQQRLKGFDFDITTERYVMRNTPGVELRSYFGSAAAKMDGALNLAGISDPAVDAVSYTHLTLPTILLV